MVIYGNKIVFKDYRNFSDSVTDHQYNKWSKIFVLLCVKIFKMLHFIENFYKNF